MIVLVMNSGSSSLKFQLINMDNGEVMSKGLVERIGMGGDAGFEVKAKGEKIKKDVPQTTTNRLLPLSLTPSPKATSPLLKISARSTPSAIALCRGVTPSLRQPLSISASKTSFIPMALWLRCITTLHLLASKLAKKICLAFHLSAYSIRPTT